MNKLTLSLVLLAVILLLGCLSQTVETTNEAIDACVEECKKALGAGKDLSNGPCLSNEIVKDWVCDVAHSPRQAIDDLPENQCSAYREGKASHFVEVDTLCNFIKAT
jgi:hypothetical protein